jgi:Carboxypeptidase regulatory-like domain
MKVKFCLLPVAVIGLILAGSQYNQFRIYSIKGRVVSATTGESIEDALVMVESGTDYEENGLGSYVRTDEDGRFTAEARGTLSVRVWKLGYAERGVGPRLASEVSNREVVVRLRELTPTHHLPELINKEGFGVGDGFSFASGKVVDGASEEADIILGKSAESGKIYLEACGEAGLIFQLYDETVDFYNTPEAPATGYEKRLPLNRAGLYYVMTRNGKHYAKVRLLSGLKTTPKGSDFSYYWPQWVYQPDGSRNLEVRADKNLPFPLEKFGINRESLRN